MKNKLKSELQAKYLCGIITESQYHEALASIKDAHGSGYKVEEDPQGVSAVYHSGTDMDTVEDKIEELPMRADDGENTLANVSLTIGYDTESDPGVGTHLGAFEADYITSITVNAHGTKVLTGDDYSGERPPSRTELRRILDVIMNDKRRLDMLHDRLNRHR